MIEYQGWATIRESYNEKGECDLKLKEIVGDLKSKISRLQANGNNRIFDLAFLNGTARIYVIGNSNHKDNRWFEVFSLFENVAEIAVGSYGVLSCWDNEDVNGYNNEIQNFILKRGTLIQHKDHFLSPCIPSIEDDESESR